MKENRPSVHLLVIGKWEDRQTPLQILGELQDRHTVTETSLTSGGNPEALIKGAIGCVAREWK